MIAKTSALKKRGGGRRKRTVCDGENDQVNLFVQN